MKRQNWYLRQEVDVDNMVAIETQAQGGIKDLCSRLDNRGIISGSGILAPGNLVIGFQPGAVALEDGSIILFSGTETLDLSTFVPNAGNAVVNIFAVPAQSSDNPVVTPAGNTINYDLIDDKVIIPQVQANGVVDLVGNLNHYVGVLLGQVTLTAGQAAIVAGNIDTTLAKPWYSVAELLAMIDSVKMQFTRSYDIQTVVASANMVLDASQHSGFDIALGTDVVSVDVQNTYTGQRIILFLQQDATGNRAWPWGPKFKNTANIEPTANKVSYVEFIVRGDGNLYALDAPAVV